MVSKATHPFTQACRALHIAVFALAMTAIALHAAEAKAASPFSSELRIVKGRQKFDETWQFAVAYEMRSPRLLRARHLELALGMISTSQETRPFVSLGPVWRLPAANGRMFVDFGISPTLVAGSNFNGRDLGGVFHFTSSVAAGAHFGANDALTVALRLQHTSNGGLHDTNPGLDMAGIEFTYDFDK